MSMSLSSGKPGEADAALSVGVCERLFLEVISIHICGLSTDHPHQGGRAPIGQKNEA